MKSLYILLIIFYFSSARLNAQEDLKTKDVTEMSLSELMSIEVTSVSKQEENIFEAPQTLIIITEQQIENRGYTNLEQLFHDLPGFDISRGNGTQYSQIYQRGYRSNNTERTLLLIDGVEENDLWSRSAWISRQYPMSNIKRVEIIYGPASTMYGANAFLGVINVITKNSADIVPDSKIFGVSASGGYGTWNTRYADLSLSGTFGKLKLTTTGRFYKSDEMDLSDYEDFNYDLNDYNNDDYQTFLGTADNEVIQAAIQLDRTGYYNDPVLGGKEPAYSNTTNDWLINTKLEVGNFSAGFQVFERDEGYGAWYRDDFELGSEHGGRWVPKNYYFYSRYKAQLSHNVSFKTSANFKTHTLDGSCEEFYYIGYMNGEYGLSDLLNEAGELLPESERPLPYWWHAYFHTYSQQLSTESRLVYNLSKKMSAVLGFEYKNSHIQGEYLFCEDEKVPEENSDASNIDGGNHFYSFDIGVFTQANYHLTNNLNLVLGGRYDYNRIRVSGGYGNVFSPKAALVFTPSQFSIKAIYSEAFQDASFWTKYGTTLGRLLANPNLKPEKVNNSEISFAWEISENSHFNVSGYHSNYFGAVGTIDTTYIDNEGNTINTTQHQAVGNLRIMGVQTIFNIKWGPLRAYVNYNYTNPNKVENSNEIIRIGDIASHRVNWGVNYLMKNKLNFNLRANWVGERLTGKNTTISSNPVDAVAPYLTFNGAVTYNITDYLALQFIARNIFNTEYFHPGVRSAGGAYYASIMPQNEFNCMARILINL
ncbi:MAG: TonB-dependent receptor [Bacteroidota bacterium]|nr:TonB-dependent receptor [Bacteroidota bacterium]